jgi:aerobic carbon-monoxide dehydrogenase large subunit
VNILQGDTDAVAFGMGTGGSRSTTMSGGAIAMVSDKIITKGRKLAAHILEASEGDIEFKDGRFTIAGTDRAMGIHELAKATFQLEKLPAGMEPGLYEIATYRAGSGNFPNGCHSCEVEIDPETGSTQMVAYWVVDDLGTVINPMLVKGQIMGGIAQGMGQVLMEDKSYDEAGQVLTGSFMDYAMPRADNFCAVVIEDNPVPTPTNPLGVKGAGEAGTVGSLSAGVTRVQGEPISAAHPLISNDRQSTQTTKNNPNTANAIRLTPKCSAEMCRLSEFGLRKIVMAASSSNQGKMTRTLAISHRR